MNLEKGMPSWFDEFCRAVRLKSMVFLSGNILDQVPIGTEAGDGSTVWNLMPLNSFLERYLFSTGYKAVGSFDPFDGLSVEDRADMKGSMDKPKTMVEKTRKKALEFVASAMQSKHRSIAIIFNFSSRLVNMPGSLNHEENELFTSLLKTSLEAKTVFEDDTERRNLMIFLCDKLNDLPAFMFVNNPASHSVHIARPGIRERRDFIVRNYRLFYTLNSGIPTPTLAENFAAHTGGMTYSDMLALGSLSNQGPDKIPLEEVKNLCRLFKYGNKKSEWEAIGRERLMHAREEICKTVKGQDEALNRVFDIIKRAKIGLAAGAEGVSNRPRGILFFAGPTGVGKTEMAKALAKVLFGDSDRCIRFDMSEYGSENSDQRLLGAPPGYIGFNEGGQLTRAVKEHPFSVLLFDEIDKAHYSIFDKFLQILDDGRLTDGHGETVYFSECVIIFTSNKGITDSTPTEGPLGSAEEESYEQLKTRVDKAINDHFNITLRRPEILNRFGDNFVVFDYIRPTLTRDIVYMLVGQLKESAAKLSGIRLAIDETVIDTLVELSKDHVRKHGGRGIRNLIDEALVNPLCREMFDGDVRSGQALTVRRVIDFRGKPPTPGMRFGLELTID
jgi:energy-coupling factor transporter ATP-binding protein EcfA2